MYFTLLYIDRKTALKKLIFDVKTHNLLAALIELM
jgi:hypothetical protein